MAILHGNSSLDLRVFFARFAEFEIGLQNCRRSCTAEVVRDTVITFTQVVIFVAFA